MSSSAHPHHCATNDTQPGPPPESFGHQDQSESLSARLNQEVFCPGRHLGPPREQPATAADNAVLPALHFSDASSARAQSDSHNTSSNDNRATSSNDNTNTVGDTTSSVTSSQPIDINITFNPNITNTLDSSHDHQDSSSSPHDGTDQWHQADSGSQISDRQFTQAMMESLIRFENMLAQQMMRFEQQMLTRSPYQNNNLDAWFGTPQPPQVVVIQMPETGSGNANAGDTNSGGIRLPELPGLPQLPNLPELPRLPQLPGLPNLPGQPGAHAGDSSGGNNGGIQLPGLPQLPNLPRLPELPTPGHGLPSLPGLPFSGGSDSGNNRDPISNIVGDLFGW